MSGERDQTKLRTTGAKPAGNLTAWKLNELGIDVEAFRGEWHFTAGKIAMLAGDSKSALGEFIEARPNFRSPVAVDREIRKLHAGHPK
jgi:hypothetical protein